MVGPKAALNIRVSVRDEVHRSLSVELDTIVAVIAVIGRSEVFEFESCWNVDVCVAASLVGVPPVGGHTVEEIWRTVGGTRQSGLSVGDFHQSLVKRFPSVRGRTCRDTVVRRGWHVSWVGVERG